MSEKNILLKAGGSDKKLNQHSLSKRQKSIIHAIVQMGGQPVTAAAISEKLSVSSRTILRELPEVERWLSENDFRFVKKRGKGIAIIESAENLALVEELLHIEKETPHFDKDDRRARILGTLFFAVSPVKAYVFTSEYDIAEGTLFNDLDILDHWLEDYRIKINRRPGLGIFITGEETDRRQAIINALFEFFDINRLPALIDNIDDDSLTGLLTGHPLIAFYEPEIIKFAREAFSYCEKNLNLTYTDSSRISLINRVSLAIYRMRNLRYLQAMPPNAEYTANTREYKLAVELGHRIQETFGFDVPDMEIAHITAYLFAMRTWTSSSELDDPIKAMDVRQLVLSMIGIAEQMTGIPFRNDNDLIDGMTEHISAMKKRLSLDLTTGISHGSEIREGYPAIYEAAETACQILRDWIYPKDLKESDIGFIATYFAASAECLQKNAMRAAVAVVCPLGVASSRMLAASLVRYFPEIEIRKTTSAFSIDENQLKKDGVDLIISTAQIHTDYPHLCVNKILQAQDKMMIRNALDDISRERLQERMSKKGDLPDTFSFDHLKRLSGLGTEIVEITDHFHIIELNKTDSVDQMIQIASADLAESPLSREKIAEDFRSREKISDTYIKEMEICLLHCKTNALSHSRFLFISLDEPLDSDKGLIRGAVAMAVPSSAENTIYLEPAGRLSSLLVEEEGFLQALLDRDTTAGIRYIEKALVKYYKHKINKCMEV